MFEPITKHAALVLLVLASALASGCGDRDTTPQADTPPAQQADEARPHETRAPTANIPPGDAASLDLLTRVLDRNAKRDADRLKALAVHEGTQHYEAMKAFTAEFKDRFPIHLPSEVVEIGDLSVSLRMFGSKLRTIGVRKSISDSEQTEIQEPLWGIELDIKNRSPGRMMRPLRDVEALDNWGNAARIPGAWKFDRRKLLDESLLTKSEEVLPGKSATYFYPLEPPRVENQKFFVLSIELTSSPSTSRTYKREMIHFFVPMEDVQRTD